MSITNSDMDGRQILAATWENTIVSDDWATDLELSAFAHDGSWVVHSVGYLVYADADCLVLASRIAANDGRYGRMVRLPRRAIMRIERLSGGTSIDPELIFPQDKE